MDAIVNLQRIKLFVESNGNKNVKTKLYPNLNHLFQHCATGSPNEYSQIEETISPEVLKDISDFILTQTE